jgi:hypothetical protein
VEILDGKQIIYKLSRPSTRTSFPLSLFPFEDPMKNGSFGEQAFPSSARRGMMQFQSSPVSASDVA